MLDVNSTRIGMALPSMRTCSRWDAREITARRRDDRLQRILDLAATTGNRSRSGLQTSSSCCPADTVTLILRNGFVPRRSAGGRFLGKAAGRTRVEHYRSRFSRWCAPARSWPRSASPQRLTSRFQKRVPSRNRWRRSTRISGSTNDTSVVPDAITTCGVRPACGHRRPPDRVPV